MRPTAVAFLYLKENRYGVHVLIGALEKEGVGADVYLLRGGAREVLMRLRELAERYDRVIFAMSLLTTQLPRLLDGIRLLNRRKPANVVTVAGGPHPSGDPCGTLNMGFDFVVVGEGERSFPELVRTIGEGGDAKAVPGVAFREDGEFWWTGPAPRVRLDDYPPFAPKHGLFNPIEITRGCPFGCAFCQVSRLHGSVPRHRSIDVIVEYCRLKVERGRRDLRFIAPNALGYGSPDGKRINMDAIAELLSKLAELKKEGARVFLGSFPSEIRPEFATEEALRMLRRVVDNKKVIVGAQSGSERMLKLVRRGHTVEDVLEAVENARRVGFQVDVDFIFGLPGETEEDIEMTINLMKKLASLGARIHAHTFLPLPGTPLASAPPGRVPDRVKKLVYRLTGDGKVYGQWETQERLAAQIDELRRRGVIMVGRWPRLRGSI